jgi:hypothetical protein
MADINACFNSRLLFPSSLEPAAARVISVYREYTWPHCIFIHYAYLNSDSCKFIGCLPSNIPTKVESNRDMCTVRKSTRARKTTKMKYVALVAGQWERCCYNLLHCSKNGWVQEMEKVHFERRIIVYHLSSFVIKIQKHVVLVRNIAVLNDNTNENSKFVELLVFLFHLLQIPFCFCHLISRLPEEISDRLH